MVKIWNESFGAWTLDFSWKKWKITFLLAGAAVPRNPELRILPNQKMTERDLSFYLSLSLSSIVFRFHKILNCLNFLFIGKCDERFVVPT